MKFSNLAIPRDDHEARLKKSIEFGAVIMCGTEHPFANQAPKKEG